LLKLHYTSVWDIQPVEVEDLSNTKWTLRIKKLLKQPDIVNDAKEKRICTVDACCRKFGFFTWNAKSFDGWTNKFVFPPHEFTFLLV
jgi:S-adenosylmethionine:tRNA ribosyltransferase-isomerase